MPIGSLLACTWNIELMEELYEFEGKELLLNKVDTLLGPGLNIHRHPLNGRNYEYFSEDPLLSGLFSKASIVGMHKSGTEGTLKHFAANDQEKQRNHIDAVASERCLREIHLKGFEIAVKEGNARSIMTAYNPINGIQSASNYDLNTTILRNEWGFEGIVMTDWWAIMNDNETGGLASRKNTSFMLRAQNDLYMVVPTHGAKKNQQNDNTVHAIETEELTTGELQRSVINILNFILNAPVMDRPFEKVRTTEVTHSSTTEEVVPVEGDIVFQTTESTYKWIEVKEEEEYYVSIETQYNDSPLAQSMLNFLMNDVYLSTIQMNGRGHKWLNQIVGYVRLVPGHYKIELLYKTPGMKVGSVKINRV